MPIRKLYLPGINGLRAIAALSVVLAHALERMVQMGFFAHISLPLAKYSVTLFFVISGFLITYLLLLEKESTGISIKNFYIRRIFRIWPLYYLFVLICFCFYQYDGILEGMTPMNFCLYMFLMPNVPFIANDGVGILNHYWSIGVEEQFYLVWPIIMKINYEKLLLYIVSVLIALLLLKISSYFLLGKQSIFYRTLSVMRFPSMLIGAIGAFIYHKQVNWLINVISGKVTQILSWMLFFLIGFNLIYVPSVVTNELVSVVSLLLIFGQISAKKNGLSLENSVFNFIGRISYGMYIMHPLIIVLVLSFFNTQRVNPLYENVLAYLLIVSLTIIFSYLSYRYVEKPFLRLKDRFTTITLPADSVRLPALL